MERKPSECTDLALRPDPSVLLSSLTLSDSSFKQIRTTLKFLKLSDERPHFRGAKKAKRRYRLPLDMCTRPDLVRSVSAI